VDACERLYLPKDLCEFAVERHKNQWQLLFPRNRYRICKHNMMFGKNIIVSVQLNWSTDDFVLHLQRSGAPMIAATARQQMHRLQLCLCWSASTN
jgi:hypothetical protein